MKIATMVAELPPRIDGIGDYTALMSAELARTDTVTVYSNDQHPHDPIPGVTVVPSFRYDDPSRVRTVYDRVAAAPPDWFVLQYNPFAYGHRGRNFHLPWLARRIAGLPGTRFALMVHERHVPSHTPRFFVMSLWQRPQFHALAGAASLVLFSTDVWMADLQRRLPRTPMRLAAIGSAVPDVGMGRTEARERLGIPDDALVLGFFGTAHISKALGHVAGAARAVRDAGFAVRVLHVGPDSPALRDALGDIPLVADGALPPDEVSRRFAAMDMQLCAFTDGVATRRSSMMTGLQHGVATVGTRGFFTGDTLGALDGDALLLSPADDAAAFARNAVALAADPALRRRIGDSGKALYDAEYAYPVLARRLRQDLRDAAGGD